MKSLFKTNGLWLVLFAITDITFIILTYLIRPEAMRYVSLFIVLFSFGMIFTGYIAQKRRIKKICDAIDNYLSDPSEETKDNLALTSGGAFSRQCDSSFGKIQQMSNEINDKQISLINYQEYIEAWTHEIKTPLSLMTLVHENHRDEMSAYVSERLNYSLLEIERDVELILYFARLQTDHVDYNFSRFSLDVCAEEVIKNYMPLAKEKNAEFIVEAQQIKVVSDQKVLSFVISQLIGNAVKYTSADHGKIMVTVEQAGNSENKIRLKVSDNGHGVPDEDLPFIYDKGFTGNHPDRQKATGMGLYLVKKYAADLNIEVRAYNSISPDRSGFTIELLFPVVS